MTNAFGPDNEPLWLAIEQKIQGLSSQELSEANLENTIQGVARELDGNGINLSNTAGHMMALRGAIAARVSVGRPMMEELDKALGAFTLDDLVSPYKAASQLTADLGRVAARGVAHRASSRAALVRIRTLVHRTERVSSNPWR